MKSTWTVELATTPDATEIVGLIKEGFPPEQRQLSIYGCRGIKQYIAELIALQAYGGDSLFLVARSADSVLGFLHIRRLLAAICLNNAAIAEEARGLGIYRSLMVRSLLWGKENGYNKAVHDVVSGDPVAAFHQRIGYRIAGASKWLALELPIGRASRPTAFADLAQANTLHRRYGFSQFTLVTQRASYQVGRLSEKWFRITSPDLLEDRDALYALGGLDDKRSLLCICPLATVLSEDLVSRQVLASHRMEGEIDSLLPVLLA